MTFNTHIRAQKERQLQVSIELETLQSQVRGVARYRYTNSYTIRKFFLLRTNIKINTRQFFKHMHIHALAKLAIAEGIDL